MKPDLVLLHGVLGSASQLQQIIPFFSEDFNCHVFEFFGHGERASENREFSIASFSEELIQFVEKNELNGCAVFGYSMGGYVALHAEASKPGTFSKIITFATKYNWTPETSKREVRLLDPEMILHKVPEYATKLQEFHGECWKNVLTHTAQLMLGLGDSPVLTKELLQRIHAKVLLCVGDSDKMVSIEETAHVRGQIANSQLAVIPGTAHPLEKIPFKEVTPLLKRFLV